MLGRMIGPFSTKPISMLRISPIGLVSFAVLFSNVGIYPTPFWKG
jgi:hypothetical protein